MNGFRRVYCGFIVLSLLLLVVVSGWGSMSVAPLSLKLDITPGEDGAGAILVRNTGPDPIIVNLSLHDWWRTPEGDFQILLAETLDRSCAPWMVYSATTVNLAPGEETRVSVQLSVPEDVTGDHWALLLVEEQPQPVEEEQADEGLTNTTRIVVTYAVKVLQTDPVNDTPDAEIQGIELVEHDPFELLIHFANTGNAHITTEGTIEIRDIFGETVRSFVVDPFPTLPGEERPLRIQDSSGEPLAAGTYYAIALLDFGGEYLIQGGLPFEVAAADETEGS
jgi:P pilus assembly chaperone PapD